MIPHSWRQHFRHVKRKIAFQVALGRSNASITKRLRGPSPQPVMPRAERGTATNARRRHSVSTAEAMDVMGPSRNFMEVLMREAAFERLAGRIPVARYVLKHGRIYLSATMTSKELARALEAMDRAGSPRSWRMRECFWNAQRLVVSGNDSGLRYVEGYVLLHRVHAIHHAWASLNGKVLDVTHRIKPRRRARFRDRVFGAFDDREYLGVEIDVLSAAIGDPLLDDVAR